MVEWAGCDLSNFECGVMFDPRCANSNINTFTILGGSLYSGLSLVRMVPWAKKYEQTNKKACSQWQVCGQKSLVAGRGHSRTTRFVQADRWPTKMQVTAQYHSDVQEGILNQTTSQILKWMDHSSKTPCQVPLCQLKKNEKTPWWGCHHHCTVGCVA